MPEKTDRAILFLNLGGPETLDDVKPFLYRLFSDPEVIRIKWGPLRKWVAWMISSARTEKSKELYQKIGGGSPIRRLTDNQAAETETHLNQDQCHSLVRTAFSCSDPLVEDVVNELFQSGTRKFLAFPLYPQYSFTTTKSALDRVRSAVKKLPEKVDLYEIPYWNTHPSFIEAHVDLIRNEIKKFSDPNPSGIHLVFSAHSIPEKLVTKEGDPYKNQMEETVLAVLKSLNWKGKWTLAWQSKLGPVKWLEPFTVDAIEDIANKGGKRIIVIPIAFVSDHIETLEEIDHDMATLAENVGIKEFKRTPGLNCHPQFIEALVDLAKSEEKFWN